MIVVVLGVFATFKTLGAHSRVKGWLDSIFTLSMVLPPTVVGYFPLVIFGNLPGVTQTMPIAVYFSWASGDLVTVGVWVALIVAISCAAVFGINGYLACGHKFREVDAARGAVAKA